MPRIKKHVKQEKSQDPPIWQNRITGHGLAKVCDLEAHPLNPRLHGDFQSRAVQANLKDLGWLKPIIVNQRTKRILDGHLRVKLAIEAGVTEVPVDYVDLNEELESQALLTLDPMAELAEIEARLFVENLEGIRSSEPDVMEFLSQLAERNRPMDYEKDAPEVFPSMDENLETEYRCPRCDFEWRGQPR